MSSKNSFCKATIRVLIDFFLGSINSRLGFALLSLIIGIVLFTQPFITLEGKEIEKNFVPYTIGTVLIAVCVFLVVSWIKTRKK